MSKIFISVLNMSLTASYVIIAVMILRLLLKKAPKVLSYGLWSVVAFRLICPVSFESMFSLLPKTTSPIPQNIVYEQVPRINSGISNFDQFVNTRLPVGAPTASVNPIGIYIEIGAIVWILGIIAMLLYSLVSIMVLKNKLKDAKWVEGNIYEAGNLKTPFVLGIIRPKVYLPLGLGPDEKGYILKHEQAHIKRYDHIVKPLAFFLLALHWFNPLVWLAFILMSKDMELSCDEKVLRDMDSHMKKPYANSLLSLAAGRPILNGSPLAFGEGNVKGRIKNILNYKKAPFWIVIIAMIVVVGVSIGLLANPKAIVTPEVDFSFLGVYEFDELLYMNPTSSYYPDDETAYLYKVGEKEFAIVEEGFGQVSEKISNINWEGNKISDSEWKAMFEPEVLVPDISSIPKDSRVMYVISDKYRLFHIGEEIWISKIKGEKIWRLDRLKLVDLKIDTKEPQEGFIEPTSPDWFLHQNIGADMTTLDYTSDDIIIFHGYFGLFVYDLNKEVIIRSLDLQEINCAATQGDNYCDVVVSKDGNIIQLHPMSSANMYVYTVSDHSLKNIAYQEMKAPFKDNGYGELHSKDWTLGTLSYRRGDKAYDLFADNKTVISSIKSLSAAKVVVIYTNPTGEEVLYGNAYRLEKKENEKWTQVPFEPNVGWKDIGKILASNQSVEETTDLKLMHGELTPGAYRLIRSMHMGSENIDVITEFTLK